jgi:hypothetical protein
MGKKKVCAFCGREVARIDGLYVHAGNGCGKVPGTIEMEFFRDVLRARAEMEFLERTRQFRRPELVRDKP